MVGALKAEGFQDVVDCFTDAESFGEDMYDAVEDFRKKDFDGVKNGIEAIGKGIIAVSHAVSDCKNIVADWEKLAQMAAIFAQPETLVVHIGKDILIHGISIYKDLSGAVKNWDSGNYEGFG